MGCTVGARIYLFIWMRVHAYNGNAAKVDDLPGGIRANWALVSPPAVPRNRVHPWRAPDLHRYHWKYEPSRMKREGWYASCGHAVREEATKGERVNP